MFGIRDREGRHYRKHDRGLDNAMGESELVELIDEVDQAAVTRVFGIVIVPISPVDEQVDQATVAQEIVEMKTRNQQGKNILGTDALETISGAVAVYRTLRPIR